MGAFEEDRTLSDLQETIPRQQQQTSQIGAFKKDRNLSDLQDRTLFDLQLPNRDNIATTRNESDRGRGPEKTELFLIYSYPIKTTSRQQHQQQTSQIGASKD